MRPDFGETYDEYVWRIYGFFAYRLRNRSDAEDLTQLTFERALRAWDRFDTERASIGSWLVSIAHNLLIDHYRADRSTAHRPIGPGGVGEDELPGAVDPPGDLGLDPQLAAALEQLQPREREIIALRFGGDLSGPEIAELTGLSLANVQQILSRSLRRLRAELEKSEPTEARVRGVRA
jgi:RNA polymerase sigma-70 factor (ECF subfamily)